MNCKHYENNIILLLYNELSKKDEKKLNDHLNKCENCRKFIAENKIMFSEISETDAGEFEPEWDEYWTKIDNEISNTGKEKFSLFPFNSKALSFAMSIVILVAGIFIGRSFIPSPQDEKLIMKRKNSNLLYVKDYFENVKPVMLDYANYTIPMNNGNGGPVDKKIIRSMLDEVRLIKRHISPDKDPYLATLLEELELILTEIKNVTPGEKDSMRSLQEMIREKDIPIKIDLFKNKVKRSQRI